MYFLLNLSHYVKSCRHFCQFFLHFLRNIVMSRDPRSKFQNNFYVFLILHLILGKFLVEKPSTSKVISQNLTGGGLENTPRSALGLK